MRCALYNVYKLAMDLFANKEFWRKQVICQFVPTLQSRIMKLREIYAYLPKNKFTNMNGFDAIVRVIDAEECQGIRYLVESSISLPRCFSFNQEIT